MSLVITQKKGGGGVWEEGWYRMNRCMNIQMWMDLNMDEYVLMNKYENMDEDGWEDCLRGTLWDGWVDR